MSKKHKARRPGGRRSQPAPALGIDIGRVIISPVDESGADTQFLNGSEAEAMATPASPGALAAIADLWTLFQGRVWIVSKCGPRVQARSRRWLVHHGFHTQTGVPQEHLRFCRERRDKAIHARQLGLTHFVDDRADVLRHLEGLVEHRFLFGPQRKAVPPWAVWVEDWAATQRAITRALAARDPGSGTAEARAS